MPDETATLPSDPTVERVFSDPWRDACAANLADDHIALFIDHPERCHPDNRLLLISVLAKRLHDERAGKNGSYEEPCESD